MDHREEIIRILLDGIDEDSLKMVYGMARAARRDAGKRKKTGDHVRPKLSRRMETVKLLLEMKNEDYIFKTYHYLLAKHRREKGGAV